MRRRTWLVGGLVVALCGAFSACVAPKSERLSCDDVDPASGADFARIQALVSGEDKGCQDVGCHGGETQQEGLRLDTPDLVYDELSSRPDLFYGVLASGEMPEEKTAWSDEDLKLFRSWYCSGAFPP